MSQYKGSNLDRITPELRAKDRPEISNEQALSWWGALSSGVSGDESLGINLNDGKYLYFLADDGSAVRALREGESLSNPGVLRRLMENSLDGRLFTLDGINGGPRQVITEPQEPFEAGVANRGYYASDLPWPDRPEEAPVSPSFWKYLLWPFSSSIREEFRTYKAEKENYDRMKVQEDWISSAFNAGEDIVTADYNYVESRRAEEKVRAEEELKDRQRAEEYNKERNQRKQEWDKDVSTMSLEEFKKYRSNLTEDISSDVFSVSGSGVIQTIVSSKYASVDDVYDGLARIAEAEMNAWLFDVRKAFEEKGLLDEYLTMEQKPYQKAKDGLRDYVRQKFDPDLVQKAQESHHAFSDETSALLGKMDEVWKNIRNDPYFAAMGLNFDANNIPKQMFTDALALKHMKVGQTGMREYANNLKEQMKQQPQKEGQQVQAQVQVQQPQPEPPKAGPIPGR